VGLYVFPDFFVSKCDKCEKSTWRTLSNVYCKQSVNVTLGFTSIVIGGFLASDVIAQRYSPAGLCAITNNSTYESITLPIALGGDYPSGSTQSISITVGDTEQPGGGQAATGDNENVVILLDTDNNGTPELLNTAACNYNQAAAPPGCTVTQNISIPTVTEDTTYRGRVMLSYNDTNPANGCGNNGFGDSQDFILVANVQETITLTDVSAPEDGGPIVVTATLSHDVRDASGFVSFTVDYQTLNGTATIANNDFVSAFGTLTFNGQAGDTETFTITPVTDPTPEGDEVLTVELLNLSNITHGIDISDTATVTLIEDDTEVALDLVKTVSNINPKVGDTVIFTLQVNNAGPSDAVDAVVQDTVPAGFATVTPLSAPIGSAFSISGNSIDWTSINIPAGGSVSATFSAVVLAP